MYQVQLCLNSCVSADIKQNDLNTVEVVYFSCNMHSFIINLDLFSDFN